MKLCNPYTRKNIEYPLNLDSDNIIIEYYITHETFFCSWHTSWLVLHLQSGDVIYIPYGERNRRDIYVVTPWYLNKTVKFPHGVYTLKYNEFLNVSSLNISDKFDEDNFEEDDDFDEFFFNNYMKFN